MTFSHASPLVSGWWALGLTKWRKPQPNKKKKINGPTGTLVLKISQQGVEGIVLANEAEIPATSGIYQVW